MIFVTVGTHEQPFNRLIQKVDELKKDGVITEDVIIQTGFSTYEPKYCQWSKLIPYQQMIKNVADARIVITHGGPASFIMPLQIGKTPIVVPRQHQFNEHVNDHQVEFARNVAKRMGTIIEVEDVSQYTKRNCDEIDDVRRKLDLPLGKVIYVYSGGFIDRKNQREAITAFLAMKKNADAVLLLLGDGTNFEALKDEFSKNTNILFRGKVSNVNEYLFVRAIP